MEKFRTDFEMNFLKIFSSRCELKFGFKTDVYWIFDLSLILVHDFETNVLVLR